MSKKLGIYEAKTSLSKLIKAVKNNGSVFQITDRGVVVAQLGPVKDVKSLDDRMHELAESGSLVPAEGRGQIKSLAEKPGALARFLEDRE